MKQALRTGYTTGSCAAGAAKAAALALLGSKEQKEIDIALPGGHRAVLPLAALSLSGETATVAIVKDGGDDPDITTGLKIFAAVTLNDSGEIELTTGEGIGTVTLKGLKIAPGEPAINPVPRRMICDNLRAVLPQGKGAHVFLSIPGGEEIARKTFNPKLGIVGGLSILGSTGIVHPMSEEALKESIALELKVLLAKGIEIPVLAFGNYGLDFLRQNRVEDSRIVKVSNYIGFLLDEARRQEVKKVIIVGHLGKAVKLAGGIFQTHSRYADCRMEILTAHAALLGAGHDVLERIFAAKTTSAVTEIIADAGLEEIYRRLGQAALARCRAFTYNEIEYGLIIFGDDNRPLFMDANAEAFLKELTQ